MNKKGGSTLISVICAFFVFSVCLCIVTVSFNMLLGVRNRIEKFSSAVNECEAAFYSGTDTVAEVTERNETVAVYDEEGNIAFSFDAVIRRAEFEEIELYGIFAEE